MTQRTPIEKISIDQWLAVGEQLFGTNPENWKFKCTACGHSQSIAEVKERHPTLGSDEIKRWIHVSCEGRQWACRGRKPEAGCDWTLGGLFRIHKLEVDTGEGLKPAFEFDHPDAKRLIQESCLACAQGVCPNSSHPGYTT